LLSTYSCYCYLDLSAGYVVVDGLWLSSQDPVLRRLAAEFVTTAKAKAGDQISFVSLDSEHEDWPLVCSTGEKLGNITAALSMRRLLREWQEELENDIARQSIISKWVQLLVDAGNSAKSNTLGVESLRPAIKDVTDLYIMRLSTFVHHQAVVHFHTKPLGNSSLVICLVRDLPTGIAMCSDWELEQLNIASEEAFDIAIKNMKKATGPLKFEPLNSSQNLLVSTYDDSYDSSRLAIPEIFEKAAIPKQHLLIFAPDRDRVLLVDSRDKTAIMEAFEFSNERQNEAAKPLGPTVFRFSSVNPTELEIVEPDYYKDDTIHKLALRAAQVHKASLYQTQRTLLQEWDVTKVDQDTFHAPYVLFESDTGIVSATSLTRGVAATLPVCDFVLLQDVQDGVVKASHQIKFNTLRSEFPQLIQSFSAEEKEWISPDFLPRFFVVGDPLIWPTEQDLQRMRV
jgi:hypothetical protein